MTKAKRITVRRKPRKTLDQRIEEDRVAHNEAREKSDRKLAALVRVLPPEYASMLSEYAQAEGDVHAALQGAVATLLVDRINEPRRR